MPRAALMNSLAPNTELVAAACRKHIVLGPRQTAAVLDLKFTELKKALEEVDKLRATIQGIAVEELKVNDLVRACEGSGGSAKISAQQMQALKQKPYEAGDYARKTKLENDLLKLRADVEVIQSQLNQARLENAPFILRDDCGWGGIDKCSSGSFDNHVLHVVTSAHNLSDLCGLDGRELRALSRMMHRSVLGEPDYGYATDNHYAASSFFVSSDHASLRRVMSEPSVCRAGLFADFLFIEADGSAPCDLTAHAAYYCDEAWWKFCSHLFQLRCSGIDRRAILDYDGMKAFNEFRTWSREYAKDCGPLLARYFEHWPELMMRLALLCAITHDAAAANVLPAQFVVDAAAFLQAYAPTQLSLLRQLQKSEEPGIEYEERLQALERKMADRGRMTMRDIVRTCHAQNYAVVEPLLAELVRRGRVRQEESYFTAANVSVSASAASSASHPDSVHNVKSAAS